MHSDNAFHVTMAGGLAFYGSSVDNHVYAVDLRTGERIWSFSTEGPVRFAPTYDRERVFFGSDDGFIYALDARNGALLWKYRPGPSGQKLIGNGRLISTWPVRSSILVDEGEVFCCAGVWPFEGLFICALRWEDGALIWKNDTIGDRSHDLEFGGISPHGYLVASKEVLFVPSGRAMPAAFDRKTGSFLYYASPGAKRGGSWALLDGDRLLAGVDLSGHPEKVSYDAKTGQNRRAAYAWFPGRDMVITKDRSYVLTRDGIYAIDRRAHEKAQQEVAALAARQKEMRATLSGYRKAHEESEEEGRKAWSAKMDSLTQDLLGLDREISRIKESSSRWQFARKDLETLVVAGEYIYTGGGSEVMALTAATGECCWSREVEGVPSGLAAADPYLLVSTDRGIIYCFGPESEDRPKRYQGPTLRDPFPPDDLTTVYREAAEKILDLSKVDKGFCLVLDCNEGRLACALAGRSDLKIIGIERDEDLRIAAREKLLRAGLWGHRVMVGPWAIEDLPPYFANLVVSDEMVRSGGTDHGPGSFDALVRPSGGVTLTCTPHSDGSRTWTNTVRGDLEDAGVWTHLYGNPENTACSQDQHVKGPFGLLWYGEPGPRDMVDRHGRACGPVSMGGRVFHQGEEVVMAYDAYNGTFLWKREIPGAVRVRVDVDGGNLALTEKALYVATHDKCLRLDPATGEIQKSYTVPPTPDGTKRRWGYLAARDGLILGTAAMPLNMEYGAAWKDFVDPDESRWNEIESLAQDTLAQWEGNRFSPLVRGDPSRYPQPGWDLYMDYHRAGTLWHPMGDFPSWGSERTPRDALTERLMGGDALFAMDADSGDLRWIYRGERIPNISVTATKDRIFLVESAPSAEEHAQALEEKQALVKEGVYQEGAEAKLCGPDDADVRIAVALDAATGSVLWRKPMDLTGCGGDKMGTAFAEGLLLFFGHFSNHDTGFFLKNELTWRRVTALDGATGNVCWSRPLNYLRRPLIVGDTVIIEPRACDLQTGTIKNRSHPITGKPVPWEFLRPGHCCAVTSASAHTLFYRSFFAAIYDITQDKGLNLFGAIRPGCWLNMIPAGGLMIMPEASSGCTCSFPLKCSLALVRKPEKVTSNWTVFIAHGPTLPVEHLAINFGAPGDMRDDEGKVWLAWPRPKVISPIGYPDYALRFDLHTEIADGTGYFQRDYRGVRIRGSSRPWLFTSGCEGLVRCRVPLLEEGSGSYTVRLGFTAPASDRAGLRTFDIKIQNQVLEEDFDIVTAGQGPGCAVVKEFNNLPSESDVVIELIPTSPGSGEERAPLIHFMEILRE
jgi:outer membrane protein assembly factor BamB